MQIRQTGIQVIPLTCVIMRQRWEISIFPCDWGLCDIGWQPDTQALWNRIHHEALEPPSTCLIH